MSELLDSEVSRLGLYIRDQYQCEAIHSMKAFIGTRKLGNKVRIERFE